MRFKYYLRGAGFGILVTSIIFTIAIHTHGLDQKMDSVPVSSEAATEAGAVDDGVNKQVTNDNGQTVVRTEETKLATPASSENETQESKEEEPETSASQLATITPRDGYVIVTIEKGEVARTLAEELQEKGLVEDAEDFRKYMGQVGYDHRMSVGTYEIPVGASYDEIIAILSK